MQLNAVSGATLGTDIVTMASLQEEHELFLKSYQELMEDDDAEASAIQFKAKWRDDVTDTCTSSGKLHSPPSKRIIEHSSPKQSPQHLRSLTQNSQGYQSGVKTSTSVKEEPVPGVNFHAIPCEEQLSRHSPDPIPLRSSQTQKVWCSPPSPVSIVDESENGEVVIEPSDSVHEAHVLGLEPSEQQRDEELDVPRSFPSLSIHTLAKEKPAVAISSNVLTLQPGCSLEDPSPLKKSRLEQLDSSVQSGPSQVDYGSATDSSSIFSSRWAAKQTSSSLENMRADWTDSLQSVEDSNDWSFSGASLQGWDQKWSSSGELLLEGLTSGGEEPDNGFVLALCRVEKSLDDEGMEPESIQSVLASLLRSSGTADLKASAPTCERLRRRILHRPSQGSTQTVAAPVSALDWIRRTQPARSSSPSLDEDHTHVFGQWRTRVNDEGLNPALLLGLKCRELNRSLDSKMSEQWQCGWMASSEVEEAFASLERQLSIAGVELVNLNRSVTGQFVFDCLDVMCISQGRQVSETLMKSLRSLSPHFESFDFTGTDVPLYHRLVGPSCQLLNSQRFIMVDVKVVPQESTWRWAVEAFFTKSSSQVQDVLLFAAKEHKAEAEVSERIQNGHFGLPDLLQSIQVLSSENPITSWSKLLGAYRDTGL